MIRNNASAPIEYFVWQREAENKDKLVYYDQEGTYYERAIPSEAIDNALKIFSGKKRAVRRSTGGMVLAEPLQIVVYDTSETDPETPLQIRVRFQDLRENLSEAPLGEECVNFTKVVSAQELHDPFPYDFEGPRKQTFALDFGRGILPVFVFHYQQERDGSISAYFLDARDMDRALRAKKGERISVQPYRIHRAALRWTGPAAEAGGAIPLEAERARQNYEKIKREGTDLVPAQLKAGQPIAVPGASAVQDLRHYLRLCVQKKLQGSPLVIAVPPQEEESLLPFGELED